MNNPQVYHTFCVSRDREERIGSSSIVIPSLGIRFGWDLIPRFTIRKSKTLAEFTQTSEDNLPDEFVFPINSKDPSTYEIPSKNSMMHYDEVYSKLSANRSNRALRLINGKSTILERMKYLGNKILKRRDIYSLGI